jgi:hypothetical protein
VLASVLSECGHDQTNELKFNEFSEYIYELAGFVRPSNLADQGNHTFTTTSGSRIMDITMAHNAKAQFPPPKEITKITFTDQFGL